MLYTKPYVEVYQWFLTSVTVHPFVPLVNSLYIRSRVITDSSDIWLKFALFFYRPRMWEGNVFILSVCLSVQAITFECLDIENSLLVCRDILTISRSS